MTYYLCDETQYCAHSLSCSNAWHQVKVCTIGMLLCRLQAWRLKGDLNEIRCKIELSILHKHDVFSNWVVFNFPLIFPVTLYHVLTSSIFVNCGTLTTVPLGHEAGRCGLAITCLTVVISQDQIPLWAASICWKIQCDIQLWTFAAMPESSFLFYHPWRAEG